MGQKGDKFSSSAETDHQAFQIHGLNGEVDQGGPQIEIIETTKNIEMPQETVVSEPDMGSELELEKENIVSSSTLSYTNGSGKEEERRLDDDVEVKDVSNPSELGSFSHEELQDLCRAYHISIVAKTKFELIGRLLVIFPQEVLTTEDLNKFTIKELRKMAAGAYISNRGGKENIVERLIKYGKKSVIPPSPQNFDDRHPPSYHKFTKMAITNKSSFQNESIGTPLVTGDLTLLANDTTTGNGEANNTMTTETITNTETTDIYTKKRKLSSLSEFSPRKKLKLKPSNFLEMAPDVPVIIDNKRFSILPQVVDGLDEFSGEGEGSGEKQIGWKGGGRQKINVGDRVLSVKWKLEMVVEKEKENLGLYSEEELTKEENVVNGF